MHCQQIGVEALQSQKVSESYKGLEFSDASNVADSHYTRDPKSVQPSSTRLA
jgi:hypothetical protein